MHTKGLPNQEFYLLKWNPPFYLINFLPKKNSEIVLFRTPDWEGLSWAAKALIWQFHIRYGNKYARLTSVTGVISSYFRQTPKRYGLQWASLSQIPLHLQIPIKFPHPNPTNSLTLQTGKVTPNPWGNPIQNKHRS